MTCNKAVGFTGTQLGMSDYQKKCLTALLEHIRKEDKFNWFKHGDCIGADEQAHFIALGAGYKIGIHPPLDSRKRSFREADYMAKPRPYLERNHDIVDLCELLIAAPRTDKEETRSGTRATVRYARKIGRELIILARL